MTAKKSGPVSQNTPSRSADLRQKLLKLFAERPLPDDELLVNLGLYIRSGALAKMLFLNELYEKIVPIPGVICEFGVWWGQSLVLFENLRAVHEPYNHTRRVIGFDTFTGYPAVGAHDKRSETISEGVYSVAAGYEDYLSQLIDYHEQHRYAYELLGLDDRRELEVGAAAAGSSRGALMAYADGMVQVLLNAKASLRDGAPVLIVVNDRRDLYPEILDRAGLQLEERLRRHVNRRTGRRAGEFFEDVLIAR